MCRGRRRRWLRGGGVAIVVAACTFAGAGWWLTGRLVAPAPARVSLPAGLEVDLVRLESAGVEIAGWWIDAPPPAPTVLLLHGVRANRGALAGRARLLADAGYAVLAIDLPGHGESVGDRITFGAREARAVGIARDWIRARRPGGRIGVVGQSLGGAAVLLEGRPGAFDAVVLEAVYPDIDAAIRNRLAMRVGEPAAAVATPLLSLQLGPRTGVPASRLRPVDHIAALDAPVLVVAGGRDRHTTPADSRRLFAAARAPKAWWLVPASAHVDFARADPDGYRREVLGFLTRYLGPAAAGSSNLRTPAASNGQSISIAAPSSLSTGTRMP